MLSSSLPKQRHARKKISSHKWKNKKRKKERKKIKWNTAADQEEEKRKLMVEWSLSKFRTGAHPISHMMKAAKYTFISPKKMLRIFILQNSNKEEKKLNKKIHTSLLQFSQHAGNISNSISYILRVPDILFDTANGAYRKFLQLQWTCGVLHFFLFFFFLEAKLLGPISIDILFVL